MRLTTLLLILSMLSGGAGAQTMPRETSDELRRLFYTFRDRWSARTELMPDVYVAVSLSHQELFPRGMQMCDFDVSENTFFYRNGVHFATMSARYQVSAATLFRAMLGPLGRRAVLFRMPDGIGLNLTAHDGRPFPGVTREYCTVTYHNRHRGTVEPECTYVSHYSRNREQVDLLYEAALDFINRCYIEEQRLRVGQ
jgi:hypothetical protein